MSVLPPWLLYIFLNQRLPVDDDAALEVVQERLMSEHEEVERDQHKVEEYFVHAHHSKLLRLK